MNTATIEQPVTTLTLPQRAAVALGTAEHEIKLRELVQASCRIVAVTNKAGREECHTAYMVLKNTRCSITNLSDNATEDAKAFTKAVKAEAVRLLKITEAEESRLQALRDDWDAKIEAEKQAKIAAERARMDAIEARIAAIRDLPLQTVGKSAAEISAMIGQLASTDLLDTAFEEFISNAVAARMDALDKMAKAETAQRAIEIEAESQRQEAARAALAAEAERAELAELRAAAAKVAAEQAAEAKRLTDLAAAQEVEAKRQRDHAAAEQAERERVAVEAQAKANAELKAAQDKLNAEQAEFRAQQAAAQAAAILAQEIEIHHGQALEMNVEWDAAELANVAHAQLNAAHAEALADDLARCTATAAECLADGRAELMDAADEQDIDYEAIAWAYQKLLAFGVGSNMESALMLDRLNLMLLEAA